MPLVRGLLAHVREDGLHERPPQDVPPGLPGMLEALVDMEVVVMSMTLHRLDRKEILRELHWIGERMNYPKSEVVSINRHGVRVAVVKVEEHANGVFVLTFEPNNPILKFAPFMGSTMHEHDLGDFVSALEGCTHDDVWLQWPKGAPNVCVGKILGVGHGDTLTVNLTPVPRDIEEVNRIVHDKVVAAGCHIARSGVECGDCPLLAGCETLAQADKEVTDERDHGSEQDGVGAP